MPNVSPYELYGNDGSGWESPISVSGNSGSWEYGFAVYYHNGTGWVEVWNARPQMVSTSMATTSTGLTFSGTADPNNFETTAKFEYKEVGAGSYSNSGTTTTGLGDGVDSAVSYTVTATVADTWKNWESRASGTNAGGTGTGSTLTLDCRKHNASGSGWTETASYDSSGCDSCGTKTLLTYTKSGCQTYNTGYSACSDSWQSLPFLTSGCFPLTNGTYAYAASTIWGYIYYTDSGCNNAVTAGCSGGGALGPVDIQYCSTSGLYRVSGGDTCVYPSCC